MSLYILRRVPTAAHWSPPIILWAAIRHLGPAHALLLSSLAWSELILVFRRQGLRHWDTAPSVSELYVKPISDIRYLDNKINKTWKLANIGFALAASCINSKFRGCTYVLSLREISCLIWRGKPWKGEGLENWVWHPLCIDNMQIRRRRNTILKLCNIGREGGWRWHVPGGREGAQATPAIRPVSSLESTHLPHLGWMDMQAVILPSLNPRAIYNMDPPDATKWTA